MANFGLVSSVCQICGMNPGSCICTCSSPPLSICSSCMISHISSPGSHEFREILISQSPESANVPVFNAFCAMCNTDPPETICCCGKSGVLLCGKCISPHNLKSPDKVHILLPMKAKNYVSVPGYIDRLRKRQMGLELGLNELQLNFALVDECERQLVERVQETVSAIMKYREDTLTTLRKYKEELVISIGIAKKEFEDHIYEDSYKAKQDLTKRLWEYQPGSLTLFSFQFGSEYQVSISKKPKAAPKQVQATPTKANPKKKNTPGPSPAHTPIARTPRATSPQKELPPPQKEQPPEQVPNIPIIRVTPASIAYFGYLTMKYGSDIPLTPHIEMGQFSSVVVLKNALILICGKDTPKVSNCAYEINPQNGQTRCLSPMLFERFGHGMILQKRFVFVFGGTGISGLLKTNEKYEMASNVWTRISDMKTPRDFFNPCLYNQTVFLFAGRNTNLCEKYEIVRDEFSDLNLVLPAKGRTSAVLYKDRTIILLQSGKISTWAINGTEALRTQDTKLTGPFWGNMKLVICGDKIYVPQFGQQKVMHVTLPTGILE